jgi:hypothetical protein
LDPVLTPTSSNIGTVPIRDSVEEKINIFLQNTSFQLQYLILVGWASTIKVGS